VVDVSARELAEDARLALLLEVAGTPKPGNVDRHRDHPDLHFEQFLAGAVGAGEGLAAAAEGAPVGEAFETAVAGMADRAGSNVQFGALMLLVPLVAAAADEDGAVTRQAAADVVVATTVEDAVGFYRAFDHVDVHVEDPPADAEAPDVRRGGDAVEDLRAAGLTLSDVLAASAEEGGVADDLTGGFERTFDAAEAIVDAEGPLADRASSAYLDLLASEPDALVAATHGPRFAESVRERAAEARQAGPDEVERLADQLVAEGKNPGATADLVAGGLFVALRRGVSV
jgi:triphosphoribosyl-dephospho-CoA synthase